MLVLSPTAIGSDIASGGADTEDDVDDGDPGEFDAPDDPLPQAAAVQAQKTSADTPLVMSIVRPLARSITQPISILVLLAWAGVMAFVVNRSYLQASSNLATDLARYGSSATWRGVYYR